MMAAAACAEADEVWLTSDNPRSEDPDKIIEDIVEGIDEKGKVYINPNRKEAIAKALEDLEKDEVLLILGKGDEAYQIIYDKKFPFDDREVVRELLAK